MTSKEEATKTDRYIVYHQWSKDEEFRGTRAECEDWVAAFNGSAFSVTAFAQFFISHESK